MKIQELEEACRILNIRMSRDEIIGRLVEKFANTPNENGRYPSADTCDKYETLLLAKSKETA